MASTADPTSGACSQPNSLLLKVGIIVIAEPWSTLSRSVPPMAPTVPPMGVEGSPSNDMSPASSTSMPLISASMSKAVEALEAESSSPSLACCFTVRMRGGVLVVEVPLKPPLDALWRVVLFRLRVLLQGLFYLLQFTSDTSKLRLRRDRLLLQLMQDMLRCSRRRRRPVHHKCHGKSNSDGRHNNSIREILHAIYLAADQTGVVGNESPGSTSRPMI